MISNELGMTRRRLLTLTAGGLAAYGLTACSPSGFLDPGDQAISEAARSKPVTLNVTDAMFKINKIRTRYGLSRISVDGRLMKAARTHAKTMARHGKMGHSFGVSTRFPRRMKAVGFEGSAGENLGVGYRSVDAAIAGWMNSPPHRRILLRGNFNVGGIGLAQNQAGGGSASDPFWVLILGNGGGDHLRSVG